MSKVNVVLPDGRVVSVDEADAAGGTSPLQSSAANSANARAAYQADENSGVGNTVLAGAEGAADTLTFGLSGKAEKFLGGEEAARGYEERAKAHPIARGVGELAALAAPTGLLGGAAKGIGEASALGLASGAGRAVEGVAGKAAGRVAEGALFGAGAKVAESNSSGDPLTIEGVVESAGVGGLLNFGFGLVGDKFAKAGGKAKAAVQEGEALRKESAIAQEGSKVFTESPASWTELREAHEAAQSTVAATNRTIAKDTEAYNEFVSSPKPTRNAIDQMRKVQTDIRSKMQRAAFSDTAEATSDAASLTELQAMADALRPGLEGAEKLANEGELEGALTQLRDTQEKVAAAGGNKARTVDFPELPPSLRSPIPHEPVSLPTSLRDFAKKTPDSIAKLANGLDPASEAAVGRLASDLGLAPGETAAETIAGIHKKLGEYVSTIEKVRSGAGPEGGTGIISWMKQFAKKATRYSVARAADTALGGGWLGAFGRVGAGEAVGGAMNGVEDSLLGSSLIDGRTGIGDKVRNVIADWGIPAGDAVKKLGPVTAYLSSAFPSGKQDPETDPRKQAANRVNDVITASSTAPDNMFLAVEGMMGHAGDVGWKIHQHVTNAMNYLYSALPKDPGLDTTMFGSNWSPAWHETVAFAHRLEAVQDPMAAVARAISGDGHPAATEALWAVWPATMNDLATEVSCSADKLQNLTYEQTSGYSQLFKTPMSGLQNPIVVTTIQGLYLPVQNPNPGQPGFGKSPRATGRPAAVQSTVAGSSVSGLISQ